MQRSKYFHRKKGSQFRYTQNLHTQAIRTLGETGKQVANI